MRRTAHGLETPTMKNSRLGPYRVLEKIGKGGMGAVYKAVYEKNDQYRGQHVAIKVLFPQLALSEGFRERFETEIESLKKLQHDAVVRMYGYGEQDGTLFYSMELVEGTSLEDEIKSGRRFDWRETLQIAIQVCRGLKHAHDHGVFHRDIKPANLLMTPDKRIKIADFGIARDFLGTQLTNAGGVLGTADYMSPEQADGRAVTAKCDQYSLGCVMYALLAGRPPFEAKTMPEMLQLQRFAEPEPVRRYAPGTPDQLNHLILQLLSKDPDRRFPNVMVLARHMEAMEKALSRPSKSKEDVLRLNDEWSTIGPAQVTEASDDETTQLLEDPDTLSANQEKTDFSQQMADAQTIDESQGQATTPVPTPLQPSQPPRPHVTTFTTIDEEVRRRASESSTFSWHLLLQGLTLVAALALLIGGAWYLMKPATADELYQSIEATIESEGTEDLRVVTNELEEFFSRFPDDPRTEELEQYRQLAEIQRYERRARVKSRIAGPAGLSPVERVYFSAISQAEDRPGDALAELRAFLALYDPKGETVNHQKLDFPVDDSPDSRDRRLLILARRRIEKLEAILQDQQSIQMPALEERLAAADKLRQHAPEQALRMYQALVRLYGNKPWAKQAVREARRKIDSFQADTE